MAESDQASKIALTDPERAEALVAAAKLHVLDLAPIKKKLGPKWPRVSELVHKLFEKALRRRQRPGDHFMRIDELSYVATFYEFSSEQAQFACIAIAKEVCELLFGVEIEQVYLRSLIGQVLKPLKLSSVQDGKSLADGLEQSGKELVVSRTHPSLGTDTAWLRYAHDLAARLDQSIAFLPIWDLRTLNSHALLLSLNSKDGRDVDNIGNIEPQRSLSFGQFILALACSAAEYGARIRHGGQVCSITVGVPYETLSRFQSRIQYIGNLKSLELSPACPMLIKIQQIPVGTPLGNLFEIVGMLTMPQLRVLLEFENPLRMPVLDMRLGVAGIGATLHGSCSVENARSWAHNLARGAREQRAFAFMEGLNSQGLVDAARDEDIKFGVGIALSKLAFSGMEEVPHFPLAETRPA